MGSWDVRVEGFPVPGCGTALVHREEQSFAWGDQHLGGNRDNGASVPSDGCQGMGLGTLSFPLGARAVAAGLRDTLPVGQRHEPLTNPVGRAVGAVQRPRLSHSIKRLESSCSSHPDLIFFNYS